MGPLLLSSLAMGFVLGRESVPPLPPSHHDAHSHPHHAHHLPDGMPRTCGCEERKGPLTDQQQQQQQQELFQRLKQIVGKSNVLKGQGYHDDGGGPTSDTLPYLTPARRIGSGGGQALFIVKPHKVKEVVEVVQAVVDAHCVLLVQGANTGLTGGSVPRPVADGRPTVVVSMKELDTIVPIDQGNKVLCLAGVGLASLHNFLHEHFPHRDSHSILGSTFLNPTTAAGVSLGSGGTQLRKGPASTERALYLKVLPDKFGKATVKIVNTLGIQDLDDEEGEFDAHVRHDGIIRSLDKYVASIVSSQQTTPLRMKQSNHTHGTKPASDTDYKNRLCQHDDNQVNRYNADTRGEDCNRSEGKVIILASVHDTFPKPSSTKTFWISFDSLDTALEFRRDVCLHNPTDLPISMEYMDRDAFDVIDQAGRVLGTIIYTVGTSSSTVRRFWNLKLWMESWNVRGAASTSTPLHRG
jgi:D-lactate dehydrogenase (quinone)